MTTLFSFYRNFTFLPVFLLSMAAPLFCAEMETGAALTSIQHEWAHIKYQIPKKQRESAFRKLYARAKQVRIIHSEKTAPLLWEGIILTEYASERGGLRALKMIEQSKTLFEKALALNPRVSYGAAYTQLGVLYFEMPSWPLGFGDMDKARDLLKKGLSISPAGLDANYFMGKFLLKQRNYHEADRYFQRAMAAPFRPGRMEADTGRKSDAKRMSEQIAQKLNR